MKTKLSILALSALGASTLSSASSITVPTSAVPSSSISTTIQLPGSEPSVLDNFYVNLFSTYHGASLSNIGSNEPIDHTGQTNKKLQTNFDSELTTAYMVTKDVGVGPDVPFLAIPSYGKNFVLGDVGVKFFNRHTLSLGGVDLYTALILQAPTSDVSKAHNMIMGVKFTPALSYPVPHSNFKLGMWTEEKSYYGVTSGRAFKLWAAPYVNYSINDYFSLNVLYEMEAHHDIGTPAFDFTSYQTDLQPGAMFRLAPHLIFNPYVQLFTGNKITLENSALGATLSATLL